MTTTNDALNDECDALNSIYGEDSVTVSSTSTEKTNAVLKLPNLPFSFNLEFPSDYPDVPFAILGTHSTGSSAKGIGEIALKTLHGVLGDVYNPGQVCLFDLVEEAGPALAELVQEHSNTHGEAEDPAKAAASHRSADSEYYANKEDVALTPNPAAAKLPPPAWVTSDPLTVNKSTFVARACPVTSMDDVTNAVSHLLSSNKKIASATHNIKAWRIKDVATNSKVIQDYDDDGESAAGGRMLHLMQLMDVWNVFVVVTRWYGGVKLGPDRFRVINNVARDALLQGGFVREEKTKGKK